MKANTINRLSLALGLFLLTALATSATSYAQEAPATVPSVETTPPTEPDATPPDDAIAPEQAPPSPSDSAPEDAVSTTLADAAKPWNQGVTEETIAAAEPFFKAGNDFFKRSMYAKALVEYRQAIQHRDHPAIRFNMAVCLINSRQPIEAYEHLVLAMRFGQGPLGPELFRSGGTYMNALLGQLAKLRIVSDEEGAQVSLDGEELFVGPGEATRLVKPEPHLVVASKDGMLTVTQEITPKAGGDENLISLSMIPLTESVVMERRWKSWKPWAVTGAGAGVAALGVPFYLFALSNAKSYDDQTADICPSMEGCSDTGTPLPGAVKDLRSRAETQEVVAISLFALGGAAIATGAAMHYINRPQPRQIGDETPTASQGETTALSLQPLLAPDSLGFTATLQGRF